MTIRDLVLAARTRLASAGIEPGEAAMDAALLAREVLGWDRARFLAHESDPPTPRFGEKFEALVSRRERREPISTILGRREFWGLEFEVTPEVLAPRPETEIVVEEALARLGGAAAAPTARRRIADVGTGSGCLAVCLARELPSSLVAATDISPAALAVARRNAQRHGVLDRVTFHQSFLMDGLTPPFHLVISNPPYIPTGDIAALSPEVRDHEPHQALDGGPDGLDLVRRLAREAAGALVPGGWLIVEFGFGQETGVRAAMSDAALEVVTVRPDLQGIPRTIVARKA